MYVRGAAFRLLQTHPSICGISSANWRVYDNYVVLRSEDGAGFIEMFNLEVQPVVDAHYSRIDENPIACGPHEASTRNMKRTDVVHATYTNIGGKKVTRKRFEATQAHCLQHFFDFVNGEWPCDNEGALLPADPFSVLGPGTGAGQHTDL